jgi:hypothetical protein
VYLVYHNAISSFEAAKHITRGTLGGAADSTPTFSIFATLPAPYLGSLDEWRNGGHGASLLDGCACPDADAPGGYR